MMLFGHTVVLTKVPNKKGTSYDIDICVKIPTEKELQFYIYNQQMVPNMQHVKSFDIHMRFSFMALAKQVKYVRQRSTRE